MKLTVNLLINKSASTRLVYADSSEKVSGILKSVGAAMGAVVVAAGAAAVKLGAEVVQQFGELEQNLGGSEAVFGEYAASIQKTGEEAAREIVIVSAFPAPFFFVFFTIL